jgi:hypothetical protein
MRQYLIGVAAAMAVATMSAPAVAGCGGCTAPWVGYSNCVQPFGVGLDSCGGWGHLGGWGYSRFATLPQPELYYRAQPQYYYVNQGPTYTGPGMFAPVASYQQRAVAGWNGYGVGFYGYTGGPYANPSHHYYHGMPPVATPTVYSYRRVYRPRPSVRYGYRHYHAPRYSVAPHQYGKSPRVLRRYY